MKKIIYIELEGALANFESGKSRFKADYLKSFEGREDEIPNYFRNLSPKYLSDRAFNWLSEDFDVYIVTKAPWEHPAAWTDKLYWVKKHLGKVAEQRLIITPHKNLLKGDFLICGSTTPSESEFEGEIIQFGQGEFQSWESIVYYFQRISKKNAKPITITCSSCGHQFLLDEVKVQTTGERHLGDYAYIDLKYSCPKCNIEQQHMQGLGRDFIY